MNRLLKMSFWLGLFEQALYIFPTLGTVMYYYFTSIEQTISKTSKYSFGLALTLFIIFLIYKAVMRKKMEELRHSVVQTETDLKNEPPDSARIAILAKNAKRDRRTLDLYDRGGIALTLLIFALGVRILEQAMIGITTLALIACGSVLAGMGVHFGVLEFREREAVNGKKK